MTYDLDNPADVSRLIAKHKRWGLRDGLRDLKRWGWSAYRIIRPEIRRAIANQYIGRRCLGYGDGYAQAFSKRPNFNRARKAAKGE